MADMKEIVIYVHGKGGFDYRAQSPWEAEAEFPPFFAAQRKRCDRLTLIANSIGAFFSMSALDAALVDRAYLISPVVDMEKLIGDMMQWAGVREQELAKKQEIPTAFGETLSWKYLTFSAFARRVGAELTVMPDGEHWFHTEEQLRFLDAWITEGAGR